MDYYHGLITDQSWKFLQKLKSQYNFTLIGGWAVYLYTEALKSKDIDLICDYDELQNLKNNFELIKNDRLKKYEIHAGEFDIDIYTPFYSELGLPAEEIQKMTRVLNGFIVPEPEVLLILKQKAWQNRRNSLKGEKDKIDIIALLTTDLDLSKYKILLAKFKLKSYKQELRLLLSQTREVPELGLNKHQYARFRSRLKF